VFVTALLLIGTLTACTEGRRQPLSAEDLRKARKLDAALVGFVDVVDGVVIRDGRVAVAYRGGRPIEVEGWAVDIAARKPGSTMALLIGNSLIRCEYGHERVALATALQNRNYTYSGYICRIAPEQLPAGDFTFEPILLTGTGSYYAGAKVVVSRLR
jgi:hypothetical protein